MTLTEIAKQVIEAGEKATKRPWLIAPGKEALLNSDEHINIGRLNGPMGGLHPLFDYPMIWRPDAEYIVTSANCAVQLAKALLVLREALDKVGHRQEPDSINTQDKIIGYLMCCEDVIQDCNHALKQAEEIMRGEK